MWTLEQKQAIDARHTNLLVSASAGSGKTAVLVERIMRLIIDDHVPLGSFLIVTFTNAAAAEMRERIAHRLMRAVKDKEGDARFLSDQLHHLQQAQISTLHSFCREVIKANFFYLGIDPNFSIGQQQVLDLKQKEALDQVFDAYYEAEDPAFERLLATYSSHKSDDQLKAFVRRVYSFSRAHPYPDQWLDQSATLSDQPLHTWEGSVLVKAIKGETLDLFKDLLALLEDMMTWCSQVGGPEDYLETLQEDANLLNKSLNKMEQASFDTMAKVLNDMAFSRLKTIKKANKDLVDENLAQKVKEARNTLKDEVKKLVARYFEHPLETYYQDLKDMGPLLKTLVQVVKDFSKAYQNLKGADALVDFNDLEQMAIQALSIQEVAQAYKRKYTYIFIDEYQDSNRVQEELANLIKGPDNLFLVGDVKQSIYKFRMAEPGLFLEKFYAYPQTKMCQRLDLNKNFRSHPQVLVGINTVFNTLMTKDFGGLDYQAEAQLIPGRQDFTGDCRPTIHLLDTTDGHQDDDQAVREAHLIKDMVRGLIKEKIDDTKLGLERSITYGDIVILMRSIKGRGQTLRDELVAAGIPASIDEEDSYFDIVEVATVINCLKIIDNIRQDIPLLSVMRSVIGNFSDVDLATIRLVEGEAYYDALVTYHTHGDDPALVEKVRAFLDLVAGLRNKRHLPLSDLIWSVLHDTGYYHFVSGLEEGLKRKQHLQVLIEKAEQFEVDRQSGIHHFVDYLDQMKEAKVAYGGKANATQDLDAVKIMSIHKSKGLEFNVVILAGLTKQFNQMDLREKLVFHQDTGLTTKWIDTLNHIQRDTLPYTYLKQTMKRENVLEEMRILYVALTRAVYRLELALVVKKPDKDWAKWASGASAYSLSKASSYADWIMPIMMDSGELNPTLLLDQGYDQGQTWTFKVVNHQASEGQKYEGQVAYAQELQRLYTHVEPQPVSLFNGYQVGLPAKASVSDLKKQGSDDLYTPRLTVLSHLFDQEDLALERGNVYHGIFERLSYDGTPLKQQVEAMVQKGILSEADLSLVDLRHFDTFETSHIYKRILGAHRVWKEHPFVFNKDIDGESLLVQGIIDLMFVDDKGLVIVDYKSDKVTSPTALVNRYALQLNLYKEAIETILRSPVTQVMIYSIELNAWIEV